MTNAFELIAAAISIADGEIVGRVRLQKIFYLLEQKGLSSGINFEYHHYGPYSRELDEAVDAAKAFLCVKEVIRHRKSDGAPFSSFIIENFDKNKISSLGSLSANEATDFVRCMKNVSSTVIEVAATIHWLVHNEKVSDWRSELKKRKGVKTEGGRTEQALVLLERLDLQHGL